MEGFFWRQVVAQSPLTPVKGTPYDEAWRAINQWLIHDSIASRQRNVLLRNDGTGRLRRRVGHGRPRPRAGRPIVRRARRRSRRRSGPRHHGGTAGAAAAPLPQRLQRARPHVHAAAHRIGKSNRDAIGARVVVETDRLKKTRLVTAGSGFLSQHCEDADLRARRRARRIRSVTVTWPSGAVQTFTDAKLDTPRAPHRGRPSRVGGARPGQRGAGDRTGRAGPGGSARTAPGSTSRSRRRRSRPSDVAGQTRSLAALAGKPSLLLFWSATDAAGARRRSTRWRAVATRSNAPASPRSPSPCPPAADAAARGSAARRRA